MDQEQQRDHAEESPPHPDAGEADDRMVIELRRWVADLDRFEPDQDVPILEPFTPRPSNDWFTIVVSHLPVDLAVGTYQFTLKLPEGTAVAYGEYAWDGRVATRREGATAP